MVLERIAMNKPRSRSQRLFPLLVIPSLLGLCSLQPGAWAESPAQLAPVPAGIDEGILDTSVSPCDDFYRYACGGWLKKTEIPADRPSWSRGFSEVHERNQSVLRELLEDAAAGKGAQDVTTKKLGDFYATCMAEDQLEKTAQQDVAALLAPIDKVQTLDDVAREVARQHLSIGNPLFHLSSQQDFKDASRVIGSLDQGGLGLPDRDYYLKTDEKSTGIQKEYLGHVERTLTLAGVPKPQAAQQAQTIYGIEKKLAQVSLSRVERREPKKLYHRLEIEGVIGKAPKFPWALYLNSLGFPGLREINVTSPAFLEGMNKILGEEPMANLKVYLRWHVLHSASAHLSKAFVEEQFAFFSKKLTGTDKLLPRWKRCVAATDRALGEALAVPYVQKTFGADGKEKALELVKNIEAAMEQSLKTLPWMDEATRTAALGKLHRIVNKIGYPDKPRDYSALSVSRLSYVQNVSAASVFESRRDLGKIGKPLDRSEWLMTAPTVNAYYEPLLNEIAFPAGILQPPMFSRNAPRAVNYGAIGMVMGHEVTHGFDDEGRQFDADGNLRDWWSQTVNGEFERRAQCVVEQYNGYSPLPDAKLDGKLTLGENIADLGGLKLALAAYRLSVAKDKSEQGKMKGSKLSSEQLFFLGAAQSWCDKRRPDFQRLLTNIDPHSPPEFRINGPLSNMPEFAAAWKCKASDKMVRKTLCSIW